MRSVCDRQTYSVATVKTNENPEYKGERQLERGTLSLAHGCHQRTTSNEKLYYHDGMILPRWAKERTLLHVCGIPVPIL
jgi:hypothetical protein